MVIKCNSMHDNIVLSDSVRLSSPVGVLVAYLADMTIVF